LHPGTGKLAREGKKIRLFWIFLMNFSNLKLPAMDRYLIISTHTEEDCIKAVNYFMQYHASFLTQFDWGCYDNDHHAYAIVEADSHENAIMAVPPLFRAKAKVIKLCQFKPGQFDDVVHEKNK
jgi:hypothetical protein